MASEQAARLLEGTCAHHATVYAQVSFDAPTFNRLLHGEPLLSDSISHACLDVFCGSKRASSLAARVVKPNSRGATHENGLKAAIMRSQPATPDAGSHPLSDLPLLRCSFSGALKGASSVEWRGAFCLGLPAGAFHDEPDGGACLRFRQGVNVSLSLCEQTRLLGFINSPSSCCRRLQHAGSDELLILGGNARVLHGRLRRGRVLVESCSTCLLTGSLMMF